MTELTIIGMKYIDNNRIEDVFLHLSDGSWVPFTEENLAKYRIARDINEHARACIYEHQRFYGIKGAH